YCNLVPNSSTDCVPTFLRDRSLLHPSNNHIIFVFLTSPLTAFQQISETVAFCIPQTTTTAILFSTAPLTAFQHF
ncbi:Uncharacterized protein APZ42_003865, partial [Daphnia magna]